MWVTHCCNVLNKQDFLELQQVNFSGHMEVGLEEKKKTWSGIWETKIEIWMATNDLATVIFGIPGDQGY